MFLRLRRMLAWTQWLLLGLGMLLGAALALLFATLRVAQIAGPQTRALALTAELLPGVALVVAEVALATRLAVCLHPGSEAGRIP